MERKDDCSGGLTFCGDGGTGERAFLGVLEKPCRSRRLCLRYGVVRRTYAD